MYRKIREKKKLRDKKTQDGEGKQVSQNISKTIQYLSH